MADAVQVSAAPTSGGTIEARSIDWVPDSERHGRVWAQGPFWFLGNFQPFTVGIGLLGPVFGLSLGQTALASILGILFGTGFMAFHAAQGPTFGLPQMIQSRAQLGYRGVVLALVATAFTFVGFNVVDTVIIKVGLNDIFGWNTTLVAVVITVLATALAIYGHDWLHRVFQVLFWISLPFWVVLTIGIITGHAGGQAPAPAAFTWAGFLAQFTIAASYNITYAPYVSDYTRYLPRDTSTRSIVTSVFFGASGSPIWLIPLGAWLGTRLGAEDPLAGLYQAGNNVVGWLGGLLSVLAVLALVATMGLNAYSGMLTVVTGIDALRPVRPTVRLRVVTIIVLGVVWLVLGLAFANASTALNDSLLVMLYLLAPWTAVNLVDFFFVRHGHYAITDLFKVNGIYGAWARRGVIAYLVGIAVEIPFMVIPSAYTGPLAKALSEVDISWIVGMAVGGGLYLVLARSLDLSAEQVAIRRSEGELAAGTAR
ncbi:MAG: purine-cytosine permease family protein [Motilibacteraceae bacterium]